MLIYCSVGLADWPQTEVVGPTGEYPIESRHHYLLVQQDLISSGQLAYRFADTLYALL